jgi:hypothetical protein
MRNGRVCFLMNNPDSILQNEGLHHFLKSVKILVSKSMK